MYCSKCGTYNEEGERSCRSCGWELMSGGSSTACQNRQVKTSGAAKAALILAIIALFTFGLTALPALICGIIALVNISKSHGSLKGKGFAIFGIVSPLLAILLFMIPWTPPSHIRALAKRLKCGENICDIKYALMMYANEYDGKLPDAANWGELIENHTDIANGNFVCPSSDVDDCSYAMNINAAGKTFDSLPGEMVLVFESLPGCNQAGGPELLNTDNHRNQGCNVLFCGGHVEFVKIENFERLVWDAPAIEETLNKPKKVQDIIKSDASEKSDASD